MLEYLSTALDELDFIMLNYTDGFHLCWFISLVSFGLLDVVPIWIRRFFFRLKYKEWKDMKRSDLKLTNEELIELICAIPSSYKKVSDKLFLKLQCMYDFNEFLPWLF